MKGQLPLIVRMKGLEPPRPKASDPKSDAAANYATCADSDCKVTNFAPTDKIFVENRLLQ